MATLTPQKIRPFLWFDHNALEAAKFYCSLFPNSYIMNRSEMLVEFILDGSQFVALNGRKKMKDIGEAFNIKLSTLTSIVDKIERQKFVRRINSKEDRRAVYLDLTPKGKRLYEKYSHYIHVMALLMKRTISRENFGPFVEELQKITQMTNQLGQSEE